MRQRSPRLLTMLFIVSILLVGSFGAQLGGVSPARAASNDNAVEWDGLFHDQSPQFFNPFEPTASTPILVKLRVFRNDISSANVKYYDAGTATTNWLPMTYLNDDVTGTFSYYTATIPASSSKKYYRLQVNDGSDTDWVGRYSVTDNEEAFGDFFVFPDFKMPEWSKSAIYYQIFPDRFYDGDPANNLDFVHDASGTNPDHVSPTGGVCPTGSYRYGAYCAYNHASWSELPAQPPNGEDMFGGDLPGITAKIDPYLKGTLGVNALYLNPIFHSPSNHKYDTQDFGIVDPTFGTNADLQTMIATAHNSSGAGNFRMAVMLDGVFNHTSDWHQWMDRNSLYPTDGAFESQSSVWYNRYAFQTWPTPYCSWFGFESLPKLNFADAGVKDEIYRDPNSIMLRYLKPPYSIDGWRYDVANEVSSITDIQNCSGTDNHAIWRDMRSYVKTVNPEALMLGEYWQNGNSWILGADEWDSLMNYNGHATPLTKWINCVEVHGENPGCLSTGNFNGWVQGARNDYPWNVQLTLMNSLSTHDTSRFLHRAGGNVNRLKLATIFQMTWLGAPTVYYGDEVGLTGDNDPDNRRTFDWNQANWNTGLLNLTKSLIAARKQYSFLTSGSLKTLIGGVNEANSTFAFGRWDSTGAALVGLNNSDSPQNITLNAFDLSLPDGTVMTDIVNGGNYTVTAGAITVNGVAARNGVVLIPANVNPTATPTPTATNTAIVTPTNTPTATPTATNTVTNTPVPARPDTVGVYKQGMWYLRNSNTTGGADIIAAFGGDASDLPVVGDWNGDSVDTIGVYRNSAGFFFLSDSNTSPAVNYTVLFGNPGDTPFAGRWDNTMSGSGIGVYRNSNGILYQKKQLVTGFDDFFAIFGNPGDSGFAGDWNGDGYDSIGIYRPGNQTWYLSNNNTPSGITFSDIDFVWNLGTTRGVTGDWDGDGTTTVGLRSFDFGVFVLHSTNATAGSDNTFAFGPTVSSQPVAGKWTAPSRPPLSGVIPGNGSSGYNNEGGGDAD
jgi:alpha-glucosidase